MVTPPCSLSPIIRSIEGYASVAAANVLELVFASSNPAHHTAIHAMGAEGAIRLTHEQLQTRTQALAKSLVKAGLTPGDRVLVLAPNSAQWIETALAIMAAGGVVTPIDTQMGAADLAHVANDATPWRIITTAELRERLPECDPPGGIVDLADTFEATDESAAQPLPTIDPEALAALFYTSGTTGAPKGVPLTHRNLVSNVEALLDQGIAHRHDRVLLPLPLHHVYPFSIGLLSVLAVGATLILPRSLVGPRIAEALRAGRATILLGVPRLYEALWARLAERIGGNQRWRERLLASSIGLCAWLQQHTGRHPGRWLFRPVMRQLAPDLRLAVSGGAALDPALGKRLEMLGWTLATGYGLTETSPILTLNAPGEARLETAGKPLPGVELRIENGEVLARGPNVFAGYRNAALSRADIFDANGWLHTGDAGEIDADGYLHLRGRLSSTIVLAGGENIDPERIENALANQPGIREAGVLETQGRLAAVIVTDDAADAANTKVDVNAAINAAMQQLPRHHALGDVQISADPLPRTRLGKLRRHRLVDRYVALSTGEQTTPPAPIAPEDMAPEDQALLADTAANAAWQYLATRFCDQRLTPDTQLNRDLGLDSLSWVELSIALREHAQVELDDAAIGRVESVRDLLTECIHAQAHQAGQTQAQQLNEALRNPDALLTPADQRQLAPRGALRHAGAIGLLGICRLLNRAFARIEVSGSLPNDGPYLITPRHISAYDPIALTGIMRRAQIEPLFWAGWTGLLFSSPWRRAFSRIARILPIDPGQAPRRSLALAASSLQRGHSLIWFPEGQRGQNDTLQPLRPGIGLLLDAHPVPVVPIWIEGSDEVLPIGRIWPKRGVIQIRIGQAIAPDALGDDRREIVANVDNALRALSTTESPSA